jgi:hypothetical protein
LQQWLGTIAAFLACCTLNHIELWTSPAQRLQLPPHRLQARTRQCTNMSRSCRTSQHHVYNFTENPGVFTSTLGSSSTQTLIAVDDATPAMQKTSAHATPTASGLSS